VAGAGALGFAVAGAAAGAGVVGATVDANGLALEEDLGADASTGAGVALEENLGGALAGAAAGDCARELVARAGRGARCRGRRLPSPPLRTSCARCCHCLVLHEWQPQECVRGSESKWHGEAWQAG
jgi:hypothetical protein